MTAIGTDEWFARLFHAADGHAAANGEWDHAVGDLQTRFRAAFGLLTPARRRRFLEDPDVRDLADLPGYAGLLGLPG
jgi:hypothetical protein